MIKPVTGKSEYAPRYKHMPVLIYSKGKLGSNPNRQVPGPATIETPPEHNPNHNLAKGTSIFNNHKMQLFPSLP